MKFFSIAAAGLLLGTLALAQQTPASTEGQDSNPSLAAAQAANKQGATGTGNEAAIRQLLDMVGTRALMMNMMAETEKNLRPLLANSSPPGADRDQLIELFLARFHAKANPEQLLDLVVPVYQKYLSDEDVKGLIEFYSTPLGQKAIQTLPKITSDCAAAGRKWGEPLGRESMMEVLSEHPELTRALKTQPSPKP